MNGFKGYYDYWIIKLDDNGSLQWQKNYGGSGWDLACSIKQTSDGGYIVAGNSDSRDGDIKKPKGLVDFWIVKLSPDVDILQSDVSDSVFSIVMPQASASNIDMGQVLVGSFKDSVIVDFITNTGYCNYQVDSIFIRGTDAASFKLSSGFPKYILKPEENHFAEFSFFPSRIGPFQAEIVIISKIDTILLTIQGEGIEPKLSILSDLIDFGIVEIGKSKDTNKAITIKNIGNSVLNITKTKHSKPNDYDFSTIAGGGTFALNPGDTCKMDLRFKPSYIGRTNGVLEFHYNDVGSPAIIQLLGEGVFSGKVSIVIKTINIEAYAGNEIEVPIILNDGKNLNLSDIKSIKAELTFNPTLLLPKDYNEEIIDNKTAKIIIDNIQVNKQIGDTLLKIRFLAGLGNKENCSLLLSNAEVIGGSADISYIDGTFKLLGICPEGGNRLINPSGQINIASIKPNPSDNEIEVELELVEKTGYKLIIVNSNGQTVREINRFKTSKSSTIENIGVTDLASGVYNLILQTESERISKMFLILK
jgi:hypothetical protein